VNRPEIMTRPNFSSALAIIAQDEHSIIAGIQQGGAQPRVTCYSKKNAPKKVGV